MTQETLKTLIERLKSQRKKCRDDELEFSAALLDDEIKRLECMLKSYKDK